MFAFFQIFPFFKPSKDDLSINMQNNLSMIENFIKRLKYDLEGLASHCKANTTFTFHFSVINA